MFTEHEWLLVMVPELERVLISAGEKQHLSIAIEVYTCIRWPLIIQFMYSHVTLLNSATQRLSYVGVGDGIVPNRYCLIGYGIFGERRQAHFRRVDGQACYVAAEFPRAQRQLVTAGAEEDGYEAIQFALDNVPFRNSPFIAKNVLLITDEGRTIIPEGENITQESIAAQLKVKEFWWKNIIRPLIILTLLCCQLFREEIYYSM